MARAPMGTSCPSCDAPARAGARVCARCGYRFLEDSGPARKPPLRPLLLAGGVAALAVAAVAIAAGGAGGGSGEERVAPGPTSRLEVISGRPLSTRDAEAAIEEIYVLARDDDAASVSCSPREAKPAHSVRRCMVRYANGVERRVVLLTNARGNEVLSRP